VENSFKAKKLSLNNLVECKDTDLHSISLSLTFQWFAHWRLPLILITLIALSINRKLLAAILDSNGFDKKQSIARNLKLNKLRPSPQNNYFLTLIRVGENNVSFDIEFERVVSQQKTSAFQVYKHKTKFRNQFLPQSVSLPQFRSSAITMQMVLS